VHQRERLGGVVEPAYCATDDSDSTADKLNFCDIKYTFSGIAAHDACGNVFLLRKSAATRTPDRPAESAIGQFSLARKVAIRQVGDAAVASGGTAAQGVSGSTTATAIWHASIARCT